MKNLKANLSVIAAIFSMTLASCSVSDGISSSLPSGVLSYSDWLNSDEASDVNGDRKIDLTDYGLWVEYKSWELSDDGADFDGDRKITISDYIIWAEYSAWRKSDDASDLNNDTKINYDDYKEWLVYLDWKASENAVDIDKDSDIDDDDYLLYKKVLVWVDTDEAFDFNQDRKINYLDYILYLDYKKWLGGTEAKDFDSDNLINQTDFMFYLSYLKWKADESVAEDKNEDGVIDIKDFILLNTLGFSFAGVYYIDGYTHSGDNFYITSSKIDIDDLGYIIQPNSYGTTFITISSLNHFSYAMTTENRQEFGSDIWAIDDAFSNAMLVSSSESLVIVDTYIVYQTEKIEYSVYLIPSTAGFITSFTISQRQLSAKVSFVLKRV